IRPPALPYLHHDIWGLTAMILYGLAERYRHHMTQR
ncbi:MAG: CoA pyrophosphatase, partial [Neisseria sp.]